MEAMGANGFPNICLKPTDGPPGFVFAQLLQTLIAAHCALTNSSSYPEDYGDKLKESEEFDFIVVGAGQYLLLIIYLFEMVSHFLHFQTIITVHFLCLAKPFSFIYYRA